MAEAHDKGNALETSVRAIESAILKSCPAYSEKTFHIESKKILNAAGVHHEIDIWVMVELASAYNAIFVFECKNIQEKVDKNDILVFTEKIKVAGAQTGFFVARSFTADAEAQAAKELRIPCLRVADLPTADIPVPMAFHILNAELESLQVDIRVAGAGENPESFIIDLETASFAINGERLNLKSYVTDWASAETTRRCNSFRSESVPSGDYPLSFAAIREYSDVEVMVNGQHTARMALSGQLRARVAHAVVVSYFEIATRGRAIYVKAEIPGVKVNAAFVTVIEKRA